MEIVTGIPSPAQCYEDRSVNLNRLLIKNPSATVFMTVNTNRYSHMSIYNGDILVIDRSKQFNKNSLVIYESQGEFTIGRVFNIKTEATITGTITSVIHFVKER